jgi:hypothetical protein
VQRPGLDSLLGEDRHPGAGGDLGAQLVLVADLAAGQADAAEHLAGKRGVAPGGRPDQHPLLGLRGCRDSLESRRRRRVRRGSRQDRPGKRSRRRGKL